MPKRRHEEKDLQYYKKKIRKIERKMKRRCRRRDGYESDTSLSSIPDYNTDDTSNEVKIIETLPRDMSLEAMTDLVPEEPEPLIVENPTSTITVDPEPTSAPPTISSEVLLALGDLMPDTPAYGLHSHLL